MIKFFTTLKCKTKQQRVGASDVQGVNLEYFGQSLQGGVDLDNNQYPDVAVGAPKSDTIAIFRFKIIKKKKSYELKLNCNLIVYKHLLNHYILFLFTEQDQF